MRLIIPCPQADETISSIVDRACSFYRAKRRHLLQELMPSAAKLGDFDLDTGPPVELLRNLAAALRMSTTSLENMVLTRPDWRLMPNARVAYCPKCWADDVRSGRDNYFRADWSWCFSTSCYIHDVPLEKWSYIGIHGQRQLFRGQLAELEDDALGLTRTWARKTRAVDWSSSETRAVWSLIRQHEDRVRKIMADDARFSDKRLRWLYCLVVGDWHRRRAGAPMDALRPSKGAGRLLAFQPRYKRHCQHESTVGAWDHFRSAPDPGYRRTANWLVACITAPSPVGLPSGISSDDGGARVKADLLAGLHDRYQEVFQWALYPRHERRRGGKRARKTPCRLGASPTHADQAREWAAHLLPPQGS